MKKASFIFLALAIFGMSFGLIETLKNASKDSFFACDKCKKKK